MAAINKEQILSKTHYGLVIYSHILREYYPEQTVLSLSGRTCSPTENPFNADKLTLNVFIEKDSILGNALDNEFARHTDSENAIPPGDAFDFAELHYKQSGDELLKTLNKDMNLHIGERWNFYSNRSKVEYPQQIAEKTNSPSPLVEGSGVRCFSFFKAPVRNTIPHKNVSLVQVYKYIVGDYAKVRTEKLRCFSDQKQARQYKATNFDYCTFSGIFQTRNDKALVNHSGLLCIDFDHLQNVDLLRNQLLQDEYFETQLLFVSPSGDGLKWIISINTAKASHSEFFAAVANYILQTYKVEVDKSGRDISRACFLPYDPQAFINPSNL
ncbi:MAG: hypothetical protein KA303_02960 [Paludibacter sp.]|nr:hypothetical protein [Paludibacter sp.]